MRFSAARNQTSKEKCFPSRGFLHKINALLKALRTESVKYNIVFKYNDLLGAGLQPVFDARHMRFENSLFRIMGMLSDDMEFDMIQKTNFFELDLSLLTPVQTLIQRDAVDLVEIIPVVG